MHSTASDPSLMCTFVAPCQAWCDLPCIQALPCVVHREHIYCRSHGPMFVSCRRPVMPAQCGKAEQPSTASSLFCTPASSRYHRPPRHKKEVGRPGAAGMVSMAGPGS